jgi:hypothetical protein
MFVTLLKKGQETVVLSWQRKLKMTFTKKVQAREGRICGTAIATYFRFLST